MSRALQINTVVEYPSRYDIRNIELAKSVLEKLQSIGKETPSEALASEIKKAQERYDAEVADKITWIIGILPSNVYKAASRMRVKPITNDSKIVEVISHSDEVLTNLVLVGLKGFKNFKHADGTEVVFKTVKGSINGTDLDIVDPEVMNVIPWEHQVDIGNEVRMRNSVGNGNLKN